MFNIAEKKTSCQELLTKCLLVSVTFILSNSAFLFNVTQKTLCLVYIWEGYNFGVQHIVQTIKDI